MTLQSSIFRGQVVHQRVQPQQHAFSYPHSFFCFDLSELETIAQNCSLFGYNEFRALTLKDSDYLHGQQRPIHLQVNDFLAPLEAGQRTLLVTSPRYLGYAFNPVNFHLRMQGDVLLAVIAEVNNTFGDRHVYPLHSLTPAGCNTWSAKCPKNFHVSPFNNMDGDYHFTFHVAANQLRLGVDLYRDGECVIKTWLQGSGHPLTSSDILRHTLRHPMDTAFNSMPRILWQAGQLYFKKKLKIFDRPTPQHELTLRNRDQAEASRRII